jgi:hypothetical protein
MWISKLVWYSIIVLGSFTISRAIMAPDPPKGSLQRHLGFYELEPSTNVEDRRTNIEE